MHFIDNETIHDTVMRSASGRVFDVVMHRQADWSMMENMSNNYYNFSIHLKFCDFENCTL